MSINADFIHSNEGITMFTPLSQLRLQSFAKYMLMLAVPLVIGCSGATYETAPVSGTITLKGKPAANVFVQFEPASKETADVPSSTAITNAQGKYTLKVSIPDGEAGAVVGEHIIRFAPAGKEEAETTEGPEADAGPVMRLSEEATSGKMRYTVPEGGDTSADFDLK
jgi:hypothetical protein